MIRAITEQTNKRQAQLNARHGKEGAIALKAMAQLADDNALVGSAKPLA